MPSAYITQRWITHRQCRSETLYTGAASVNQFFRLLTLLSHAHLQAKVWRMMHIKKDTLAWIDNGAVTRHTVHNSIKIIENIVPQGPNARSHPPNRIQSHTSTYRHRRKRTCVQHRWENGPIFQRISFVCQKKNAKPHHRAEFTKKKIKMLGHRNTDIIHSYECRIYYNKLAFRLVSQRRV